MAIPLRNSLDLGISFFQHKVIILLVLIVHFHTNSSLLSVSDGNDYNDGFINALLQLSKCHVSCTVVTLTK